MNSTQASTIVWTVSQDGGQTISGAYGGKSAKAKAVKESAGASSKMTVAEFRRQHPTLTMVFFDR